MSDAERGILFSVIIPTHRGRESVLRAVRSVLVQSYTNLEVIVVSDGEIELTREILASVSDARLTLVGQSSKGSSAARNLGIRTAHGNWITFLDDDDIARPEWLGVWSSIITAETFVVTGEVAYRRYGKKPVNRPSRLLPHDATMAASSLLAGGFAVRRDILRAVGGYDPVLRVAENQDLGLRICEYLRRPGTKALVQHASLVLVDVFVEHSDTREQRYGAARSDAATIFLSRYATRLANDPSARAGLLRIVARAERINRRYGPARAAAFEALRVQLSWQNVRSAALAIIAPPVDAVADHRGRISCNIRRPVKGG